MLNIKVHEFTKFASMRGPSGVSSGWSSLSLSSGQFHRRFCGPLLPSIMVASLPFQRCPGGSRRECLPKRQVDRSLLGGGIQATTIRVLRRRDCKVGQVSFNVGRAPAGQQVIIRRGDGTGWGWVTLLVVHFHGMGLTFGWGRIGGLLWGTH